MRRAQFLRSATSVVALMLVGCAQQPQPTATARAVGSATFALTGKLNNPRWQHTATLLGNGNVLVVGGLEHVGGGVSSSAELYDLATGKWTATGNTGGARYRHTATLLKDGRVLVAGGGGGTGASAELYDPATGKWTATGALTNARSGHTATLLGDGKVLVAGGGGGPDSQGLLRPRPVPSCTTPRLAVGARPQS